MLTYDNAINAVEYDVITGEFSYLKSFSRSSNGHVNQLGYRLISIRGKQYYAHRLAWLLTHRRWPRDQIDHINGNRSDNRLVNLRECTVAENAQNTGKKNSNTSGYVGVTWVKTRKKWMAHIRVSGRKINLGLFSTSEEAADAYCRAKAVGHAFQPTVPVRAVA